MWGRVCIVINEGDRWYNEGYGLSVMCAKGQGVIVQTSKKGVLKYNFNEGKLPKIMSCSSSQSKIFKEYFNTDDQCRITLYAK